MADSSLKIKIPAKASAEHITRNISMPRKVAKRPRITSDDESDSLSSPPQTHAKPLKKPRLSPKESPDGDYPASHRQIPKPVATKGTSSHAVTPTKGLIKKKNRILSDDEDDFVPEPQEKPATSSKPKVKDIKGKAKASGSIKFTARNESKPALPSASSSTTKKRPREDDDIDVDVTTVTVSNATNPSTASVPVTDDPPPKKKLPHIKKKPKLDSAATSTVASPAPGTSTANKPAGKPGANAPKPSAPSTASVSKKPQPPVQATVVNPSGTGDFDLRDSNTWKSLIGKGPSNSGPRVGIEKRVSTEERRKQLDKMRDEARLVREQQHRETFDLQAQSRKIAAFEKKLHYDHNVKINGPHILGAAFAARPIPERRPR